MEWICNICGYVYEGDDFTKESDTYVCPLCDAHKDEFHNRNVADEVKEAIQELK